MEPARPSVVEEAQAAKLLAEAAAIKLKAEAEAAAAAAAIKLKAEAEAAAIKLKAEAEAAAIKLKAEAEAAGIARGSFASHTFERLLRDSGFPAAHVEEAVLLRARVKYGHLVTLAIMENKPALAREAYELGKRLPSTTTAASLQVAGYKLNGLLFEGSELVICYKGEAVHVLKNLRDDEAMRARVFHEACLAAVDVPSIPHITPFELVDTAGGKHFMIMPKFSTALEPLPYLSASGVPMVWEHMRQALEGLHAKGFAHADVKPANICLTEGGLSAVLIDLGSVARLGEPTSSTPAYVPRDMVRGRASILLDWWMFAMTLAEKGCGMDHGLVIGGNVVASRSELRAHLGAHLAPEVWAALEPKLG